MPPGTGAHGLGTSQLQLRVEGSRVVGNWDLDIRDARRALGLAPGEATEPEWRELQAREDSLRALLTRSLVMRTDSLACPLELDPAPLIWNREFDYVRFQVAARCPVEPQHLTMRLDLLFDADPQHRAYFSIEDARAFNVGTFRADLREVSLALRRFDVVEVAHEFVREGIHHIWSGFDHLLFLLSLLLPAALVRTGTTWSPRPGFGASARQVVKVVTAFTLAHSITLALAYFGVVRLPGRWVEVAIALSVFAAAWNNLRPFLPGRAWVIAFGFGLVHGLGFASALAGLALPQQARALALGAFNVGVEFGQLAIVAVALPLLYLASRRSWYPRLVLGLGSLAVAWIAILWVLERAFGLRLFQ